jgi:hypothetical protein
MIYIRIITLLENASKLILKLALLNAGGALLSMGKKCREILRGSTISPMGHFSTCGVPDAGVAAPNSCTRSNTVGPISDPHPKTVPVIIGKALLQKYAYAHG